MWEDDVSGGGTAAAEPTEKPVESGDAGKDKGAKDTIQLSKKEYEALLRERAELQAESKYWQSRQDGDDDEEPAERGHGKRKDAEPEPEEDDLETLLAEDPEKFTDELSAEGIRSLVKRGFITEKRAKRLIGDVMERVVSERLEKLVDGKISKAQKSMLADAEILQKYPDLNNPESSLHKRTKEIYAEIMGEDKGTPKATALKLAARTAAAELRESREERIARQGGGGDKRSGGYSSGDDDSDLSPAQRRIIAAFNADGGVQVSEDAYRKRAKSGVNVSGKNYQPGSMNW